MRGGGQWTGGVASREEGGEARGHWCWSEGDRLLAKEAEEGPGPGGAGGDAEGRAWTHADGLGGRKVRECQGAGRRGGDLPQGWGPPSAPAPLAPGMRIYLGDNLMGCGSAVGGWLEGHLSSETCKFQHRAWLQVPPARGCREHRLRNAPEEGGRAAGLTQADSAGLPRGRRGVPEGFTGTGQPPSSAPECPFLGPREGLPLCPPRAQTHSAASVAPELWLCPSWDLHGVKPVPAAR